MNNRNDAAEDFEKFKKAFTFLAKTSINSNVEKAREAAYVLNEQMEHLNFLTEDEAHRTVSLMVNYDETKGSKWKDLNSLFKFLESKGFSLENEFYNKWALYATMCKFASDNGEVISDLADDNNEVFTEICFKLLESQLKDADKPRWVRWYFSLE